MAMTANNRIRPISSDDGESRGTFKGHIDGMRMFRGSHAVCPTGQSPEDASFTEHVSLMRAFREAHPHILAAGSPVDKRLALFKSVQFLPVAAKIMGAGGARRFIVPGERTAIISLLRMTIPSLAYN